jgi:F420-dependent oxidoreductase-like protein
MRLGFYMGYAQPGTNPLELLELAREAEGLGYDSAWAAEAWGVDAITPLAWLGAQTTTLKLGTAIMQLPGRSPANAAMTAVTLDMLSGGRFLMGLGTSGPQVVEGWHGQDWGKPLGKTHEYVEIVRTILRRERLEHHGAHYDIPLQGGTGLGKPLKPTVHPLRKEIPIHLAAEGPKNVALAAEIGDGWLPMFFSPKSNGFYKAALEEGFARPGARHTLETFEVPCSVPVIVHDDVEEAASWMKPSLALYIGGMGAKSVNFHHDVFARLGYEDVADKVQELYLAGRKDEATAAIPTSLVEDTSLIGPPEKIRDELQAWEETVVTQLLVRGDAAALEKIARALG